MKCPFCHSNSTLAINTRAVKNTGEIKRRRECLKCGKRFTTYERQREDLVEHRSINFK